MLGILILIAQVVFFVGWLVQRAGRTWGDFLMIAGAGLFVLLALLDLFGAV